MRTFFAKQNNEGFFSQDELIKMDFASLGTNVLLSRSAKIYDPSQIILGHYVRIDDFVILSGKIEIQNFVHIGASSNLTGGEQGIIIKDFCGLSSHTRVFAISDDYSGASLTNSCIPQEFKNPIQQKIIIEKHCIIGSGSILLPGAYLAEGVSVGAMSMIIRKTTPWGIYFGIPARKIKARKKDLLQLEQKFYETLEPPRAGPHIE